MGIMSLLLEDYNSLCNNYSITDTLRCTKLPDYCVEDIKDVVKILDGYLKKDWNHLQVKGLFWHRDKTGNISTDLHNLVKAASTMDLRIYV